MAFDVYSLGRSLLQMLTGHGPGHPVYQSLECGSDLRDEEPPATDDEDDQGAAGCCCGGGGGGRPAPKRRAVRLEELSPEAREMLSALTRADPAMRPTVDTCLALPFLAGSVGTV